MDFEIIKEKAMPLLNRKRITLSAKFVGGKTPSNGDVKKEVAKKLKADESLVAIRHIYQKFGSGEAKVIAHIYDNIESLEALEKEGKAKKEAKGEESGKEKGKE